MKHTQHNHVITVECIMHALRAAFSTRIGVVSGLNIIRDDYTVVSLVLGLVIWIPCGLHGCCFRIGLGLICFLAGCCKRLLNQG